MFSVYFGFVHGELESSGEGLVEEGFFQGFECGEFLLVDGFETLGFLAKPVQFSNNCQLLLGT